MQEKHLPLDGWISDDGRNVHLTWRDAPRAHRGGVEVSRRPYGATGGDTWQTIEVEPQQGLHVLDPDTQPGFAYEYRVLRRNPDGQVNDVGYWLTGRDIPLRNTDRIVHLVVDQSVLDSIEPYLVRFQRDLIGEGWQVRRYAMPRHASSADRDNLVAVGGLKQELLKSYDAAPDVTHAVILVGHVPFARSGMGSPDGHDPAPHATDLIYGDVDGQWSLTLDGTLRNDTLPSDAIEMQVGRIDFAPIADGDLPREVGLLRDYFDKNHNWRHGRLGDLREAYGKGPSLIGELSALRNVVGPNAIAEGGHHDVGERQPWLWGVNFGDAAGHIYAERYANKAVFAINFGSHKQRIDKSRNAMTALLAQQWYPLAVGWGARPTWWLHHMALGGSIGDVHMRTVNNGIAAEPYDVSMDYYPTGQYLWRNPVWVNLLGDPTLRAFPLKSASDFHAQTSNGGVQLSWTASADPDVNGYVVYGIEEDGRAIVVSGETPVVETEMFNPVVRQLYMVRSIGQKQVYAGSFQTLSQAILARLDQSPIEAPEWTVTVQKSEKLDLATPDGAEILGFVTGPDQGSLARNGEIWVYTPLPDFIGTVQLQYVVSDALTSAVGTLTITVDDG
ncbi:Ig-like domain-containing protein [Cognatiyoonia koreensis]|nr:Ig-like domain-containing protein [Cognatiyoonia koreensis]